MFKKRDYKMIEQFYNSVKVGSNFYRRKVFEKSVSGGEISKRWKNEFL